MLTFWNFSQISHMKPGGGWKISDSQKIKKEFALAT
jgi:hypothetical protein